MIVVVSGLPRSGTSMVMQMLAAGGVPVLSDGIRTADEDNPRGYFEDERAKTLGRENAWLSEARGEAVKVIAPLLRHLPPEFDYRVILLERAMDEILASQSAMLARLGRRGASLPPDRLAAAFEHQLAGARSWIEQREGVECLVLEHRQLISDPASAAGRIDRFLGGGLDRTAMASVVDPALHRQRGA